MVKGLYDYMQTDMVDMLNYSRQNKGYKWILVVLNMFSNRLLLNPSIAKQMQRSRRPLNVF